MPENKITTHLFGKKANLAEAISNGTADEFDEVFFTDTNELAFLDENNEVKYVTTRTQEDIEVPEDGFGKLNAGDVIPAGVTLDEAIKYMMNGISVPEYTAPTITITNTGTTGNHYEVGTMVNPVIGAEWVQNDAGTLSSITITKNGTPIEDATYTGSDASEFSYAPGEFVLEDGSVMYELEANYTEGPIKNDNIGKPYPNGHIEAGNVRSSDVSYTGCRKTFWTSTTDGADSITYTSDAIRAYEHSELNVGAGEKALTFPQSTKCIVLVIPATMTITAVHSDQIPDLAIGNFSTTNTQVADARGGENGLADYTAYTYLASSELDSEVSITFTLAYVED